MNFEEIDMEDGTTGTVAVPFINVRRPNPGQLRKDGAVVDQLPLGTVVSISRDFGDGWPFIQSGSGANQVSGYIDQTNVDWGSQTPLGLPAQMVTMRNITGIKWDEGSAPTSDIRNWLAQISAKFPETDEYCKEWEQGYFEWCGLTVAYCFAANGLRPVFGKDAYARFLWAPAWLQWGDEVDMSKPSPGDVVIFQFGSVNRSHVTLFEQDLGTGWWACRGGNQSDQVKVSHYLAKQAIGVRRAKATGAALPANDASLLTIRFDTAKAVEDFFVASTKKSFIDWFNSEMKDKGAWAVDRNGKAISIGIQPDNTADRLHAIVDMYCNRQPAGVMSLVRFLAYVSVFINETGGQFIPESEKINPLSIKVNDAPKRLEHPGVSYLFDAIPEIPKVSYNGHYNIVAAECFSDEQFIASHGQRVGKNLIDLHSQNWSGEKYPFIDDDALVGCSDEDRAAIDYILQADFYKFRGRGYIQTTWRPNYKAIVTAIRKKYLDQRNFGSASQIVQEFVNKWVSYSDDNVICTVSSTQDWDRLFQDPGAEVAMIAIDQHARDSNYLPSDSDANTLRNLKGPGSLFYMGEKVGGTGYGPTFAARVLQMIDALGTL
jgi:hypothetical protein